MAWTRHSALVRGASWIVVLGGLMALVPACAGKKRQNEVVGTLSAGEAYRQALAEIELRNLRKARSLLERVQYSGEEREELEPKVRMAIADATYYQSYAIALIDARALYLDFVTLYGQHPRAPYAQFQAGMCSLAQARHSSRDQSQTRLAITDLREVLRRYPNSSFAGAAGGMIRQAQQKLAEHEVVIGRFYMKRRKPLAAVERFRNVLERYPSYPEKDKLYFYLGQALLRSNNDAEARIYLDKLVTDYPDGQYFNEAIKQLDKAGGRLKLDLPESQ